MTIYELYQYLLSLNETKVIAMMADEYYKEFEN